MWCIDLWYIQCSQLGHIIYLCAFVNFQCEAISGLGFRRGSYKCLCRQGFYFPNTTVENRYFNGTELEEEYSKILEVSTVVEKSNQVFIENREKAVSRIACFTAL